MQRKIYACNKIRIKPKDTIWIDNLIGDEKVLDYIKFWFGTAIKNLRMENSQDHFLFIRKGKALLLWSILYFRNAKVLEIKGSIERGCLPPEETRKICIFS